MESEHKFTRPILSIGSITGWFAVIVQSYIMIMNRVTSLPETIIRFFSFYTILTNILVAICFTVSLVKPGSALGRFFLRSTTLTAIVVYITVVGIVYNLILRSLWEPQGMQRLVDELLHSFIPVLFIIYWFLSKPREPLRWKNAFPWLFYPMIYLFYILLRGASSGFYPYPFVNVDTLGYLQVAINSFFLFVAFLFLSFTFIFIYRNIKEVPRA